MKYTTMLILYVLFTLSFTACDTLPENSEQNSTEIPEVQDELQDLPNKENTRPIAKDSNITIVQDTNLTATLVCEDSDNNALVYIQNKPFTTTGTLILNMNGNYIYTPEKNFTGTDQFSYLCNDGFEDSNIATVSITVTAKPNNEEDLVDPNDKVVNGNFNSELGWVTNKAWIISNGKANDTIVTAFYDAFNQILTDIDISKKYTVSYTISDSSEGGIKVSYNGVYLSDYKSNGTYEFSVDGSVPNPKLVILSNPKFNGSIDNISVIETSIQIDPPADDKEVNEDNSTMDPPVDNEDNSTNENPDDSNTDIAAIIPSTQTGQDVYDAARSVTYSIDQKINADLKSAQYSGGLHPGLDSNNKYVLMFATEKGYYGNKNWVICRESNMSCKRIIDNEDDIHARTVAAYSNGKIILNGLVKKVDPDSTIFGSALHYYDIAEDKFYKNALVLKDKVTGTGLNGETRTMVKGNDGYLYLGGTDARTEYASAARVNPENFSDITYYSNYYTDYKVNRARSIGVDDTFIYQVIGDNPYRLIGFNKSNPSIVKVLNDSRDGRIRQLNNGVGFQYKDNAGVQKYAVLSNGTFTNVARLEGIVTQFPPGFNIPVSTRFSGIVVPDENGTGIAHMSFKKSIGGPSLSFTQEVDIYNQDAKEITSLESGSIINTGTGYTGVSLTDTISGISTYAGQRHISVSAVKEIYDYAKNKSRVLLVGYPSMKTYAYEPSGFFSEKTLEDFGELRKIKDKNCIKECETLAGEVGIHHPLDIAQIDESVFIIGQMQRDGVSGGLIWWNTATGEKSGMRSGIFDNYQTRAIIPINGLLAVSTQTVDNRSYGGLARPSTPKVMLIDPISKKVVKEYTPVSGLNTISCGRIATIDNRYIIGMTNDSYSNGTSRATNTFLYMIDTKTDEVVMKKTIPIFNGMAIAGNGSTFTRFEFLRYGDYIYTFLESRNLVRIDKTGNVEGIAILPSTYNFTIVDNTLYLSGNSDLIKVSLP